MSLRHRAQFVFFFFVLLYGEMIILNEKDFDGFHIKGVTLIRVNREGCIRTVQ
jgi:hypothetical protein